MKKLEAKRCTQSDSEYDYSPGLPVEIDDFALAGFSRIIRGAAGSDGIASHLFDLLIKSFLNNIFALGKPGEFEKLIKLLQVVEKGGAGILVRSGLARASESSGHIRISFDSGFPREGGYRWEKNRV